MRAQRARAELICLALALLASLARSSAGQVINTPTPSAFQGCELVREVVGVIIVRAGESMETSSRAVIGPARASAKILIQRDESKAHKPAVFFYSKLVPNIEHTDILLLDPMLASGGSAICAINVSVCSAHMRTTRMESRTPEVWSSAHSTCADILFRCSLSPSFFLRSLSPSVVRSCVRSIC